MADDIIKAKIVFDTSGLGKIAGPSSTASSGGGSSGMGMGKLATSFAGGMALWSGISKGVSAIVKSSGHLQASLNIFSKSLMLILKPIGDIMGLLIRPFALSMLKYAIPFYKWMKDSPFMQALVTPEEEKTEGQKAMTVGAESLGGAIVGGAVGGKFGGLPGAAIGAGIGAALPMLDEAWQGIQNIGNFLSSLFTDWDVWLGNISDALDDVFAGWGIDVDSIRENIAVFILETIPEWWTTATDFIIEKWTLIKDFVTVTIPAAFNKAWEEIKKFVTVTIPNAILGAFDTVKLFFTETIPSWFSTAINSITSLWNKLAFWKNDKGSSTTEVNDAVITPGGQVIKTDPADFIFATKNPQNLAKGGGGSNITVNISALDASSIDSSVIDKIRKAVEEGMSRGLSRRTMDSIM